MKKPCKYLQCSIWRVLIPSLAIALFSPFASAETHSVDQPNIVLIIVEDLSPRIGAFGDPVARTPVLDDLASESIRYTRAFTTSGVCAPSRSTMMTGMYAPAIGTQHMRTSSFGDTATGELGTFSAGGFAYEAVPPAHVKAFPELLRAAGYYTTNRNKTDYQFGQPFTVWDESGQSADWKNRAPGQPFFAMFSSHSTHESGMFPIQWALEAPRQKSRAENQLRQLNELKHRTDPDKVSVPPYLPDTPAIRVELAQHYDNIQLMDQQVGEILAELAAEDVLKNTIIIWSTDHGDGLPRAKRSLYDSGLHVPMLIRFPDLRGAGSVDEQLVSFIDLAPTLLGLAGIKAPGHLQGHDFLDPESPKRKYIHATRDRLDELPDRSRAVRDQQYKLIRNWDPDRPFFMPVYYRENLNSMSELRRLLAEGKLDPVIQGYFETPRPAYELYDTFTDPWELNNLAADPAFAGQLTLMQTELERWLDKAGDMSEMPELEMVEQHMWPDQIQPVTPAPRFSIKVQGEALSVSMDSGDASVGYQVNSEVGHQHWQLYSGPIELQPGDHLAARAIRYGYQPSTTAELTLIKR